MVQQWEIGPAYRVETPRLVVRCWEPRDAPLLNAAVIASWDHLSPWMPWARGDRPSVESTTAGLRRWRAHFDRDEDYVYAIFSRDEKVVLGSSGLHTRRGENVREIGYWIHVDHIGKGYATEASAALTRVAFEIDRVHRVEIYCVPNNLRSAAVPRKLGFTHEATRREYLEGGNDTYRDAMVWTLLATEYPASPAASANVAAFDVLGRRIL